MQVNEIMKALKAVGIAVGVAILFSLIMGAVFVARGHGPFEVGFGLGIAASAVSAGALYWLLVVDRGY